MGYKNRLASDFTVSANQHTASSLIHQAAFSNIGMAGDEIMVVHGIDKNSSQGRDEELVLVRACVHRRTNAGLGDNHGLCFITKVCMLRTRLDVVLIEEEFLKDHNALACELRGIQSEHHVHSTRSPLRCKLDRYNRIGQFLASFTIHQPSHQRILMVRCHMGISNCIGD